MLLSVGENVVYRLPSWGLSSERARSLRIESLLVGQTKEIDGHPRNNASPIYWEPVKARSIVKT